MDRPADLQTEDRALITGRLVVKVAAAILAFLIVWWVLALVGLSFVTLSQSPASMPQLSAPVATP